MCVCEYIYVYCKTSSVCVCVFVCEFVTCRSTASKAECCPHMRESSGRQAFRRPPAIVCSSHRFDLGVIKCIFAAQGTPLIQEKDRTAFCRVNIVQKHCFYTTAFTPLLLYLLVPECFRVHACMKYHTHTHIPPRRPVLNPSLYDQGSRPLSIADFMHHRCYRAIRRPRLTQWHRECW